MVIFVLIGIPAGILADRYSRKLFILCGVILWSAMMFAQVFSFFFFRNFSYLLSQGKKKNLGSITKILSITFMSNWSCNQ